MLSLFRKFFNSFLKKPDIWFFYCFLATSTLSVRKVLFYYPMGGNFNEYTGIYLYLSDIFLFLTLTAWFLLLCNKYIILSNNNPAVPFAYLKNVPRGTFLLTKKTYQQVIHNYILIFPLFIAFFSFLSVSWANNQQIAFFRSLKLLSFVILFFYAFKNVPRGTFLKRSLQIILATSIVQSIIGIIQFFIQHSIGLIWLKESIISPTIPGVAKLLFNGQTHIRAYGLFPHPNILGGFLVFSIIASLLYLKLFQSGKNVPRGTFSLTTIILLIQGLALLLTFSKSAIIGLFIGFLYLNMTKCSTWNIFWWFKYDKMFHVEHFYKKFFLLIASLLLVFLLLKPDMYSLLLKSLSERAFYINVSRGTFLSHPILGMGAGQFVLNMQGITNIQNWQFQPVHNVFLLIINEFGIFVLFLFLYFIYKIFRYSKNVPRGTFYGAGVEHLARQECVPLVNVYFKTIFIGFLFIMIFDHYFWDIQQGQILLWIVLGFIAGSDRE
jgi:hypothetical protein